MSSWVDEGLVSANRVRCVSFETERPFSLTEDPFAPNALDSHRFWHTQLALLQCQHDAASVVGLMRNEVTHPTNSTPAEHADFGLASKCSLQVLLHFIAR